MKQEIAKVHKALHRQMKAFNAHLHQPVAPLLTDSDTESAKSSAAECRVRTCSQIDVSQFCVDASEVSVLKSSWFASSLAATENVEILYLQLVINMCICNLYNSK